MLSMDLGLLNITHICIALPYHISHLKVNATVWTGGLIGKESHSDQAWLQVALGQESHSNWILL